MAATDVHRSALLDASAPDDVRTAVQQLGGELVAELESDLDSALQGSDEATRSYLRRYRQLTQRVLAEARSLRPDLVVEVGDELAIAEASGRPARALLEALEHASGEAPFSPWTSRFGLGDAVALDLVDRVRALLGSQPLATPTDRVVVRVDDVAAGRFLRRLRHHLNHPDDEEPLRRLMRILALSKSELGRIFGVSRQAVDGWLTHGVPPERQEKLAALMALCDVLERKLKPSRVPGVVRRPAEAYGGQTMLQLIASDRHLELLDMVRASFDWSQAA